MSISSFFRISTPSVLPSCESSQIASSANRIKETLKGVANDKGYKVDGFRNESIKYADKLAKSAGKNKLTLKSALKYVRGLDKKTSEFFLCTSDPSAKTAVAKEQSAILSNLSASMPKRGFTDGA